MKVIFSCYGEDVYRAYEEADMESMNITMKNACTLQIMKQRVRLASDTFLTAENPALRGATKSGMRRYVS